MLLLCFRSLLLFDYWLFVCLASIQFRFLSIIFDVSLLISFNCSTAREGTRARLTNSTCAGVNVNVSFVRFRFVSFSVLLFVLFVIILHRTNSSSLDI
jgi:hypothetical protein